MSWEAFAWLVGLFVAVVLTAALVNRVRPQHKRRIRRILVTYALYAVAVGLVVIFDTIDRPTWAKSIDGGVELLQAYLLVMVAATLVFSVTMPALGAELPLIASDLIVGLGIVASTLVVLGRHGMNPTNALVSGAVISAVLAISLQSTLGNILGGIALQLDGSIRAGDWIQFDQARVGRVREVRWRHTVVETRDFSTIIVPNAQLLAQSITILGKRDGVEVPQRLGVRFHVDYRYAPASITQIVTDALRASPIENVTHDPAPIAHCVDLARDSGESYATYIARYSIVDLALEDATASRVRARVYAALEREGVRLSVPAVIALTEPTDEAVARRTTRDLETRLAAIRKVPLFADLETADLETLARGMRPATFVEGETIFRQGAVAHSLYILAAGRAEIRTNVDPDGPGGEPARPVSVAEVTAPNFFGERGLMTGEPRAADVIALSDCECYRLDKATFETVILAKPSLANEISQRLATRRLELEAARDGVAATAARHVTEAERIRDAITSFFGL